MKVNAMVKAPSLSHAVFEEFFFFKCNIPQGQLYPSESDKMN